MSRSTSLLAVLLSSAAVAGAGAARAQPAPASPASPAGAPEPASTPVVDASAAPAPKHQLGGYVQGDGRFFLDDEGDAQSDRFELRRVRPSFKGTLWDHYDYKFLVDLAGGRVQVLDVFVDVKYVPWAVLRLGKGKTPFGIEHG
jgi:phosphate-selective porin